MQKSTWLMQKLALCEALWILLENSHFWIPLFTLNNIQRASIAASESSGFKRLIILITFEVYSLFCKLFFRRELEWSLRFEAACFKNGFTFDRQMAIRLNFSVIFLLLKLALKPVLKSISKPILNLASNWHLNFSLMQAFRFLKIVQNLGTFREKVTLLPRRSKKQKM